MTEKQSKQSATGATVEIEPIWPRFGLSIGTDGPSLQLCRPKLLPLKTFSYKSLQLQAQNRLDLANKSDIASITD